MDETRKSPINSAGVSKDRQQQERGGARKEKKWMTVITCNARLNREYNTGKVGGDKSEVEHNSKRAGAEGGRPLLQATPT